MQDLVRKGLGDDRLKWSAYEQSKLMSGFSFSQANGVTRESFDALVAEIGPWLSLPRSRSHGFLQRPFAPERLQDQIPRKPGRPPTQLAGDRLYNIYSLLRGPRSCRVAGLAARYSPCNLGRDWEHVLWAIMNGLAPYNAWPTPTMRDAIYRSVPGATRDLVASFTGGDPDDYCLWLALDGAGVNCGMNPRPV